MLYIKRTSDACCFKHNVSVRNFDLLATVFIQYLQYIFLINSQENFFLLVGDGATISHKILQGFVFCR